MRSLLVAGILIVGVFAYLIVSSRLDAPPAEPPGQAKYEAMVTYVRSLEEARRKLMVAARLKGESYSPPKKVATGSGVRGSYARGYRDGFDQGYATGALLSASTRPNPLFFPVPKPN